MNAFIRIAVWGSMAAVTAGLAPYASLATGDVRSGGQTGTTHATPSSHDAYPFIGGDPPSLAPTRQDFTDPGSATKRTGAKTTGAMRDVIPDLHLEGFLAFDRIPTGTIRLIVSEAGAGNPQARYSLAKLMHICETMLDRFPDDKILADFLADTDRSLQPEFVAAVEREAGACLDLQEVYGSRDRTAQEWMEISAEQGYGPSLAALAGAWAWDSQQSSDESAADFVEQAERRRVLVAAAVKTLNPDALFAVSGFFGAMGPMNKGQPGESLAWNMAACHFGLDCGSGNWYLQWMCRYAGDCGETYAGGLIAYLEYKQYSPSAVDYADRRVPELIGQLEAGDWDALGIAWPGDPEVHEVLAEIAGSRAQAGPGVN